MKYSLSFLSFQWIIICAFSQPTHISHIDLFGNRSVSSGEIRKSLPLKEGDTINYQSFPGRKYETILKGIPGVKRANISLVCCDQNDGGWLIYVGIAETDSDEIQYHPNPTGPDVLPETIIASGQEFEKALSEAVKKGDATEDDSQGYSLMTNPQGRAVQEKFIDFAKQHYELLKKAIHSCSDPKQRALATLVIAYSPDKIITIGELIYAVRDNNEEVRNNATRALALLARYANDHPKSGIVVSPGIFIQMLNSPIWTDRNKASLVLEPITYHRNRQLLDKIKQKVLPSLIEMASWKNPGHSSTSYIILGRIAGIPDKDIFEALTGGDKEKLMHGWINKISKQ
jgi:hypothetical protein